MADGTPTATVTVRMTPREAPGTAQRKLSVQNGRAPLVASFTSPGDGATVSGTAWFTIWVEHAAAGSKTYTLGVDGNAVATTSSASNGPISLPWITTGTPNGTRAVTVTVRDAAGATSAAVRNVNVAN